MRMTRLLTVIHTSKLANETDLEMHIRDALAIATFPFFRCLAETQNIPKDRGG